MSSLTSPCPSYLQASHCTPTAGNYPAIPCALVINHQGILKEPPQLPGQSENPRCLPYVKQWFLKPQCFPLVSSNGQNNLCLCILLKALKPLRGRIPAWPGSPSVPGVSRRKCDGELSKRECFSPKDIQSLEGVGKQTKPNRSENTQWLRRKIKIQEGDMSQGVMTEAAFFRPGSSLLNLNCRYQ